MEAGGLVVKVVYPDDKLGNSQLVLRGSLLGLNWETGKTLTKVAAHTWQTTLNYTEAQEGERVKQMLFDFFFSFFFFFLLSFILSFRS